MEREGWRDERDMDRDIRKGEGERETEAEGERSQGGPSLI